MKNCFEMYRLIIFFAMAMAINANIYATGATTAGVSQSPDFYSGRDDLTTVALGISAYTPDGRSGVSVNIYRKNDGSYVVLIKNDGVPRQRGRSGVPNEYVKAWKDSENRIYFNWKGRRYFTSPNPRYK